MVFEDTEMGPFTGTEIDPLLPEAPNLPVFAMFREWAGATILRGFSAGGREVVLVVRQNRCFWNRPPCSIFVLLFYVS